VRGWRAWFVLKSTVRLVAGTAAIAIAAVWLLGIDVFGLWAAFADKMFGGAGAIDQSLAQANASSRDARLALSTIAVSMWRHNPFFGVGIGNYPFLHQYYADLDHLAGAESVTVTPSVLYLLLLAETGVIGFVLFMAFAWRLFGRCWRTARSNTNPEVAWIALGLTGSFIGVAVNGLVLDNPFANYYWVVAGLALAATHRRLVTRHELAGGMPSVLPRQS
jgi:O-antigen ligase